MPTIDELNKRFGTSGVSTVAPPGAGGRASTIAELNAFHEKRRKEEEERRRKEEEQRQQLESKRKVAEQRVQKKEQEVQAKEEGRRTTDVFKQETVIKPATGREVPLKGFFDRVKEFFGIKTEKTIRDELVEQEKAREDVKLEKSRAELKRLGKGEGTGEVVREALQSGLLGGAAAVEATASVIARKAKAEKLAEKLDIDARKNREFKRVFDQQYREAILTDKYSTREKMRAMPVRTVLAAVAESAPSTLGILGAGAAVAYLGAPTAVAASVSVGMGGVITFGGAYQDAREAGLDEDEAEKVGFFTALTTAPLEFIPEWRLLGKIGGKGVQRQIQQAFSRNLTRELVSKVGQSTNSFVRQGILETFTEVPQTVVENAWARTYDENRQLFEGVDTAALAGFFSGGMMDTLVSSSVSLSNAVRERTGQEPAQRGINGMYIEEVEQEEIRFAPPLPEETPLANEANIIAREVEKQAQIKEALPKQREGETAEQFSQRYAKEEPADFRKRYLERVKSEFKAENVVSADEAKFAIPGFTATQSATYHKASSQFADEYAKELLARTDTKNKPVLILAGGSGAGKTSGLYLSTDRFGTKLEEKYALVQDTNLKSVESGTRRIDAALESGRKAIVRYVWRDPIEAFTNGVIPRVKTKGRIVPIDSHVETHLGARQAFEALVKQYAGNPNVEFTVIDNSNGKGKTKVIEIDQLPEMPYTESVLKQRLYEEIEKAKRAGTITEGEYKTFVGQSVAETVSDAGRAGARPGVEQLGGAAGVVAEAYKSTVENGGVTINLKGEKPSKGMAYAPFKGTEFAVPEDGFTAEIIDKYKSDHLDELSQPGNHLGLWKDGGKVYMDISKVGDPTPETFEEAMNASQLAVFDLEKFETITLGKIEGDKYTREYAKATDHPYFNRGQVVPTDSGGAEQRLTEVQQREPEGVAKAPAPRTGEGITKVSGLAESVKANAVRKRITRAFEGLPEYETINIAEQAERAVQLMREDLVRARSIALGQEDPPAGLRALAVFKAVEEQAMNDRDAVTLRDLATYSTVPYQLSVAAQEVGLARGRDTGSPVQAMVEIVRAREAAIKPALKGKSVTRVKKAIVKTIKENIKAPKQDAWVAFVEQLKC